MVRSIRSVVLSVLLPFLLLTPVLAVGPDKKLTWPGGGQGTVTFSGDDHGDENYTCADCHSGLFAMKFGTAKMTMAAMRRGEYCGACHNGVRAFPTDDPNRCGECHWKPRSQEQKGGGDF